MAFNTEQKGYYSSDKKENRFLAIPKGYGRSGTLGTKEKYFLQIKEDEPNKGRIQVWNEEAGQDRMVGYYDKDSDVFVPDRTFTKGARKYEEDFFSTAEGAKLIKSKANTAVTKDLVEDGKNVTDARNEASEITGTHDAVIPLTDKLEGEVYAEEKQKGSKIAYGTRTDFSNPNGGAWVYPNTLRQSDQDVIKFTILEYLPKGLKARKGSLNFVGDNRKGFKDRVPRGTIILPIPANVGDTNAVDWGESSMNAIQMALSNIGMSFLNDNNVMGEITKTADAVGSNKDVLKEALGASIVEAATGSTGGDLLTRETGNIMNPNMELLFKKPTLRPFTFSFRLSPRDRKEALTVINIIRAFKQSMAPVRTQSYLFLKTPNTYRIQYLTRGKDHPYMNMFKECALTAIDINYTPDGNYSTYEDGIMTSYQMNLQFKEIEPIFNDDYESTGEGTFEDRDWDTSDPGKGPMTSKIGY